MMILQQFLKIWLWETTTHNNNNKQVDVASGSGAPITGIFIKNVLPESPAGRTGQLRVRVPKPLTFSLRYTYLPTYVHLHLTLTLVLSIIAFVISLIFFSFSSFFALIIKSIDGRPDFRCGRWRLAWSQSRKSRWSHPQSRKSRHFPGSVSRRFCNQFFILPLKKERKKKCQKTFQLFRFIFC